MISPVLTPKKGVNAVDASIAHAENGVLREERVRHKLLIRLIVGVTPIRAPIGASVEVVVIIVLIERHHSALVLLLSAHLASARLLCLDCANGLDVRVDARHVVLLGEMGLCRDRLHVLGACHQMGDALVLEHRVVGDALGGRNETRAVARLDRLLDLARCVGEERVEERVGKRSVLLLLLDVLIGVLVICEDAFSDAFADVLEGALLGREQEEVGGRERDGGHESEGGGGERKEGVKGLCNNLLGECIACIRPFLFFSMLFIFSFFPPTRLYAHDFPFYFALFK